MVLLKDFDLFLPNSDSEQRRRFELQTRCVTALYARLFPKFRTRDCWKVELECVDAVAKPHYRNVGGVYVLEIEAKAMEFLALNDSQQKKVWTFTHLQSGLAALMAQAGWAEEPFRETAQAVLDLGLVNEWIWGKAVRSPVRDLVAEVLIEHGVQQCDISILVKDRAGQLVTKQLIISDQPSEWAYARHLGVLRWKTPRQVELMNQTGDRSWSVDVKY